MTRLKTLLALALLLVPSISLADTITINGTNGTWSGAVPAGSVINNGTTPRTLWWGTGAAQSGYNYAPAFTPFDATVDGLAFLLGTFTHRNYPIGEPWLTSVNLDFNLDWDSFAPDLAGAFTFTHHETPNAANPCAYAGANGQGVNSAGCADRVTIESPFLNTLINDGVVTYYFSSVGFSTDGGATASHQYITMEGQANTAGLYGKLTSVPIQVPEPTSLLLLGFGLAGLSRRLRRRAISALAIVICVSSTAAAQVIAENMTVNLGTGWSVTVQPAMTERRTDYLVGLSVDTRLTDAKLRVAKGVQGQVFVSGTAGVHDVYGVEGNLWHDGGGTIDKAWIFFGEYSIGDAGGSITDGYTYYSERNFGHAKNGYHFWGGGKLSGDDCHGDGVVRINDRGIFAHYNPCFLPYSPGKTDFERITLRWGDTGVFGVDNVAYIGVEPGGTGANRHLQLIGGGLSFSSTLVAPARTGTRFLCISTTGVVRSSTTACKGT